MKKSLILGAAAMAAMVAAPQADASEISLGGYYQLRMMDSDATMLETAGDDNDKAWYHRMQLNVDAKVSEKSHAHLRIRPVDGSMATTGANGLNSSATAAWSVKQVWMETEMYGVGVKVGHLPLRINDGILIAHNGSGFSSIVLSKTFGDTTLVGLNNRVSEGATGAGDNTLTADDDDVDLYGLSVVGKIGSSSYQLTYAHLESGASSVLAGADNDWIAGTLGTSLGSVKLTGTVIWEGGQDGTTSANMQAEDSGVLAAVRLSGKTGFGGWKGYGFYSSEDFTHPVGASNYHVWSLAWDQGGVNGRDMLGGGWIGGTNSNANFLQNVWSVGASLDIKAGSWTISPAIDYASLVENNVDGLGAAISDSAWGGSLTATTKLDEGTTFSLIAIGASPSDDDNNATPSVDNMHSLQAEFKIKF